MRKSFFFTCFVAVLTWSLLATLPVAAQYFGRNKVQYDNFKFRVLSTEHFDIYFYPEEEEAVRDAARMAERWYRRHSRSFLREFNERKSIIFYANDADFQQTNVISGMIGEGTGGVTEGLKQRVVMPLTGSYSDTDHVLGHELVHSFQYDIAFSSSADSMHFNLNLLPLWVIEGTAEYLSVGRQDPHTAMWLRDAAVRDDIPTMDQLTRDPRYFPYRYGQAYMAYIGGKYGDGAVTSLFKLGGRAGLDSALVYTIGITPDSLSKEFIQVVKDTYLPQLKGRTPADSAGRRLLAEDMHAGSMNISPAISPDGKYIAFISERDLFHVNLFIADAETGRIVKKLLNLNSNPHFDALRFINSAGSWSPDGKKFAFVTFSQGDNEISILNVLSGNIERRIMVKDVGAITHVAWSPDGRTIAFSGIDGGISDLYLLDIESTEVRQLMRDRYADQQPTWSPDGTTIAFITDRGDDGTNFDHLSYASMGLGFINVNTGEIEVLRPFGQALHHNPQYSPDSRNLFFISDHDGFKDIYRYELETAQTYRVTNIATGVSGVTSLSPAMSVAMQSGRMVFSVFSNNEYTVFSKEEAETQGEMASPIVDGIASAGVLPPVRAVNEGLVGNYLDDPLSGLPPGNPNYEARDYSAKLRLDYVAPPTFGASVGGPFGTRVGGGVGFFFSDMLGNHNLTIVAQANGTVKDIGGQVAYLNQKNRFNYGLAAGHIPYLLGGSYMTIRRDPSTGLPMRVVEDQRFRIFIDQISAIGAYPFSTTRRFEVSGGFVRYGYDYEVERYYIDYYNRVYRERESLEAPPASYFFQGSIGLVGDFSMMGFTSPMTGGRYRLQVTPMVGTDKFVTLLGDYRRYLYFKPFTFALRGLHIGNYGATANDQTWFGNEYLGSSYYPGFVRGYGFGSFDEDETCTQRPEGGCAERERLFGTRIGLVSAEFRIPLLGPDVIALFDFPYLPTELSLFADAGIAWTAEEKPVFKLTRQSPDRIPVTSVGVSTRLNLLGYMVFEIFYAYPFQRPGKGPHFGFQLMPGW